MYKWFLEPLCNHSKGRFFSRNFPSQNSQVTAGLPLLGGAESGMTRTTPWKVCPTIGRGLRLEILWNHRKLSTKSMEMMEMMESAWRFGKMMESVLKQAYGYQMITPKKGKKNSENTCIAK